MAERATRRIYVPDVRGTDQYVRLTWHDKERIVVVSHWDGSVCTAATRMGVEDASRVIGFLAASLAEAAAAPSTPAPQPVVPPTSQPWWRRWLSSVRRPSAQVLPLRRVIARSSKGEAAAGGA